MLPLVAKHEAVVEHLRVGGARRLRCRPARLQCAKAHRAERAAHRLAGPKARCAVLLIEAGRGRLHRSGVGAALLVVARADSHRRPVADDVEAVPAMVRRNHVDSVLHARARRYRCAGHGWCWRRHDHGRLLTGLAPRVRRTEEAGRARASGLAWCERSRAPHRHHRQDDQLHPLILAAASPFACA